MFPYLMMLWIVLISYFRKTVLSVDSLKLFFSVVSVQIEEYHSYPFFHSAIDIIGLFVLYFPCCIFCSAQMAELVDALGSGPSSSNGVWVRVPFWATDNDRSLWPVISVIWRQDSKRAGQNEDAFRFVRAGDL